MGHAQRKIIQASRYSARAAKGERVLPESAVLARLEADLDADTGDDYRRISGVGAGVMVGAFFWIVLIGAILAAVDG